jgi:hypothetical protein
VQLLYARRWGFSRILTNRNLNGIAVLQKQFEFANAEALGGFLVDLRRYEEKKLVRSHSFPVRLLIANGLKPPFSITQKRMCLRINMPSSSARGRTSLSSLARRRSDARVEDKDEKIQGVTARDIQLAYALEKLLEFESSCRWEELCSSCTAGGKNGRGAERN